MVAALLVMLAALPIPTWYPLAWFYIGFLGGDPFFATREGLNKSILDLSVHGESGACPDSPHAINDLRH